MNKKNVIQVKAKPNCYQNAHFVYFVFLSLSRIKLQLMRLLRDENVLMFITPLCSLQRILSIRSVISLYMNAKERKIGQ